MLIKVKNLNLKFQDHGVEVGAVKNLNLAFPNTGLIGILGSSGSGKTSLLYLLSGIREPTSGTLDFDNLIDSNYTNIQDLRRNKMGFVFQQHFLIGYLTVLENILVGLPDKKYIIKEKIDKILKDLGLEDLENRLPRQISGGQRQRVAIARAIINNPEVLFVDEPTSNLDKKTGNKIINIFEKIAKTMCVVMVTHNRQNLVNASVIYEMEDGRLKYYKPE